MTVDFTMLVRNRPRLTRQALQSLNGTPSEGVKVTIIDNESDGETADIISQFVKSNPANTTVGLYPQKYGTGKLRNISVKHSESWWGRGEYLYLSDNDVFFYPAWNEKLIPVYEAVWKEGFKVIGAYNHPYHQPINRIPIYIGGIKVCEVKEVQALALQSMLMKWEVWDKYGPFDETPPGRVRMSEDVAFTNKIKADGGRIGVIDPPLVVNTGITDSFGEKIPGWEEVLRECPPGVLCE